MTLLKKSGLTSASGANSFLLQKKDYFLKTMINAHPRDFTEKRSVPLPPPEEKERAVQRGHSACSPVWSLLLCLSESRSGRPEVRACTRGVPDTRVEEH